MTRIEKEEYYFLIERLEEIEWALDGSCNDIDCDKYMYKDLLKKKYKPILEHSFSCMKKLKAEKEALLRILSNKKYKKYRFERCNVCKKYLDKLDNKSKIAGFTKLIKNNEKIYHQWNGVWIHKKCAKKVKIPKGWKRS